MHHHTYEEAIYVIEGEGRLHTVDGDTPFKAGSSIYLPRLVSHCLENTGSASIRFCYYSLDGRFQRSPLMLSTDEIEGLREALRGAPKLRELLRRLVE